MKKIIFLAVAVAILAAFFASANPDGLDHVAETLGFGGKAAASTAIMADYKVPFIPHACVSTALAGVTGVLLTFGIFWATIKLSGKTK